MALQHTLIALQHTLIALQHTLIALKHTPMTVEHTLIILTLITHHRLYRLESLFEKVHLAIPHLHSFIVSQRSELFLSAS